MDNQFDTLEIKPLLPSRSMANIAVPDDDNHPAAATAARAKIEQIHQLQPAVTPSTIIKTSVGLAPHPFSPVERQQATARKSRPRLSRARPIISALMSFIFLFAFFKSEVLLSQIKYLTSKPNTTVAQPAVAATVVGPQSVIIIPKINVNAPIVYEPSVDETKIQKALESGVVHYGNTPVPGQAGNDVIVGHSSNDWWEPGNYKFVFVVLDKLVPGDTFNINYESKQYTYTVTEIKVVEPTDLSVLAPTSEPTVTIITCTPPGTSWKRLVVRAKQTSPDPGKIAPAATQATSQTPKTLPSNSPGFFDQISNFWHSLTGGTKPTSTPTQTPTPNSPATTPPATGLPAAK